MIADHSRRRGKMINWRKKKFQRFLKRIADISVALIVLILTSPIILISIILIRIKLGSPVIFKQQRPGLNENIFTVFKFRTMLNANDSQGKPLPDEVRLTRFGKLIRKLSIDELPQLINVLKGDLSLVGPRPLLVRYLDRYNSHQARRHEMQPGITGWAQVNGRNTISWEQKFDFDIWYIENWSIWLDFKILIMTGLKVLKCSDISQSNHVTMQEFMGSAKSEDKNSK